MKTEARAAVAVSSHGAHAGPGASRKAASMDSLLTKPSNSGIPAMEAAASTMRVAVTGIRGFIRASSRRSRVWAL